MIGRFLVERYRESAIYTGAACRRKHDGALSRAAPARPRPAGAAGARAGGLLRLAVERAGARAGRRLAGLARRRGWRWRGPRERARRTSPTSGRRGAGRRILRGSAPAARSRRAARGRGARGRGRGPAGGGRRGGGGALPPLQPSRGGRGQPDGQRPRAAGALAAGAARPREPARRWRRWRGSSRRTTTCWRRCWSSSSPTGSSRWRRSSIRYLVSRMDRSFAAAERLVADSTGRASPGTGRSPRGSPPRCCSAMSDGPPTARGSSRTGRSCSTSSGAASRASRRRWRRWRSAGRSTR